MERTGTRLVAYQCAAVPRFDPHDPDRSTQGGAANPVTMVLSFGSAFLFSVIFLDF